MSAQEIDLNSDDVEVDIDELEKQLEEAENADDEGTTEEPEGEGKGEEPEKPEETPEEEEPKPEGEPPASDRSVPLATLQEQRRRNNELQKQLSDVTAKVAELEAKASEVPVLEPISDEEREKIEDELGEEEAARQVAQREREIAIQKSADAKLLKMQETIDRLEQSQSAANTRAQLAATPELLKWYDGNQAGDEKSAEYIKVADAYMGAAELAHPDDLTAQNKFIERRVIEHFGLQVESKSSKETTKKPPEDKGQDDVSIGDLTGGNSAAGSTLAERAARIRAKDPDTWTDSERETLSEYAGSL